MSGIIYTHEETLQLLEQSRQCAETLEQGRNMPDHLLASRYTPLHAGPTLPPPVIPEGHFSGEYIEKFFLSPDTLPYRSRSQEGIPELKHALKTWLTKHNITYGSEDNCTITAISMENTLFPNLLRHRRTGSICSPGDDIIICGSMEPAKRHAEDCGLNIIEIPDITHISKALKQHPEARLLFLANDETSCMDQHQRSLLAKQVAEHNKDNDRPLLLIAKEAYSQTYKAPTPIAADPALRPYTMSFNHLLDAKPNSGFAFAYGPPPYIKQLANASFDGPPVDTQTYAAAVLNDHIPDVPPPKRGPVTGTDELRHYLNAHLRDNGIIYDAPETAPRFLCGTSINSTLLPNILRPRKSGGLCKQGDEVLVCTPIYGLLPFNAHDNGLNIIALQADRQCDYKPDATLIRQALKKHPNARILMMVNPANPTGKCLSAEEIDAIGTVVQQHNNERVHQGLPPVIVIADETFGQMMWTKSLTTTDPSRGNQLDGAPGYKLGYDPVHHFTPMASNEKLRPYTLSLNTFSKRFGPGLGFAYAYGPPHLIENIASAGFDGAALASQEYAAKIFNPIYSNDVYKNYAWQTNIYEHKYKSFCDGLSYSVNILLRQKFDKLKKQQPGYNPTDYVRVLTEPDGGFHVTIDVNALKDFRIKQADGTLKPIKSGADFAEGMMRATGSVAFPGEMFLLPGDDMLLRFSVNLTAPRKVTSQGITKRDDISEALHRIREFCLSLEPPEPMRAHLPAAPVAPSGGWADQHTFSTRSSGQGTVRG